MSSHPALRWSNESPRRFPSVVRASRPLERGHPARCGVGIVPAAEWALCPRVVVRPSWPGIGTGKMPVPRRAGRPCHLSCSDPFFGQFFVFYNILALFRRI